MLTSITIYTQKPTRSLNKGQFKNDANALALLAATNASSDIVVAL
jgi:hypothetical protein